MKEKNIYIINMQLSTWQGQTQQKKGDKYFVPTRGTQLFLPTKQERKVQKSASKIINSQAI